MQKNVRTACCLGMLSLLILAGCDQAGVNSTDDAPQLSAEDGAIIPGEYIVVLDEAAASKNAALLSEMTSLRGVEASYTYDAALVGFAGKLSDGALAALRSDARVKYIEPDRIVSLGKPCWVTGDCGGGGGGSNQETPWGITRVGGPENGTGKRLCVIDTGVDLDHPDLNVDVAKSRTYITSGKDAESPDDLHGHGSHVAGTAAAIDNNLGVVGVAAGATVVAVKVLNRNGSGSTSGVIAGVNYVKQEGTSLCTVANMSLGGSTSTALDDAVKSAAGAGIKFSLAAGNESDDASNHSPARANGPNIYTISAIDSKDVFASFSNYGNPPVDYAAPGVSIKSTYKNGGYTTYSGTSMAAPHVAGILLMGGVSDGGTVASGDPDGNPDPIAHL